MINSLHLIKKCFMNSSCSTTTSSIGISTTKLFNTSQQISVYSYFSNNFFSQKRSRKAINNKEVKKSNPNDRNKGSKKMKAPATKEHTFKKHRKIEEETQKREELEQETEFDKIKRLRKLKNKSNASNKLGSIKFKLDTKTTTTTKDNLINKKNITKKERNSNEVVVKKGDDKIKEQVNQIIESKDQPTYTDFNRVKYRVSKEMKGMRVDRWISSKLPVLPHSLICRWLRNKAIFMENGEVKIKENGDSTEEVTKRHKLKFNDKVTVGSWIYFPSQAVLDQQIADVKDPDKYVRLSDQEIKEIKDSVLYKDEYIIVLNKPQGLSVQGGTGLSKHLDMMLGHLRFEKDENPKLVHRLDKATSGILILGRSKLAATAMTEKFELKLVKKEGKEKDLTNYNENNKEFKNKKVIKKENEIKEKENEELYNKGIRKTYWALLNSTPTPKEGRIRAPLKKVMVGGEEKVVPTLTTGDGAKLAITEYKVLESSLTKQCFVVLWPETGRTHQLRVHCASVLNAPIIGDTKYGNKESDDHLKSVIGPGKMNLHLHARRIEFLHPFTDKKIDIIAPLSKELAKNWKTMGFNIKIDDKSLQ